MGSWKAACRHRCAARIVDARRRATRSSPRRWCACSWIAGRCASRTATGSWPTTSGSIDIPPSVQAVLAARLDTLPAEEKRVAQDAAVVGRIFWDVVVAHLAQAGTRAHPASSSGACASRTSSCSAGRRRSPRLPSTASGTSSSAMSPTTRCPSATAPGSTATSPAGRNRSWPTGSRSSPSSSPATSRRRSPTRRSSRSTTTRTCGSCADSRSALPCVPHGEPRPSVSSPPPAAG